MGVAVSLKLTKPHETQQIPGCKEEKCYPDVPRSSQAKLRVYIREDTLIKTVCTLAKRHKLT